MNQQERIANAHNKPFSIPNQKFRTKPYVLTYPMNDLACTMPVAYGPHTSVTFYACAKSRRPPSSNSSNKH